MIFNPDYQYQVEYEDAGSVEKTFLDLYQHFINFKPIGISWIDYA